MKMKMKFSLFLLTLILVFNSVCSQSKPDPPRNMHQMQYVLRWPQTYCMDNNVRCRPSPPMKFTLVRFLGTDASGDPFTNCRDNVNHNWNSVFTPSLKKDLENYWPSLTTNQDQEDMWKKAWEEHGACTTSKFKTPTAYFNRAVRAAKGIKDLLNDHLIKNDGIVPCDSALYKNDEIVNALTTVANKKRVSFTCTLRNGKHYLNEVTFCYNNDATRFADCPNSVTLKRCLAANIVVPRPPTSSISIPGILERPEESFDPIADGISSSYATVN